jgi:hypothetical protein
MKLSKVILVAVGLFACVGIGLSMLPKKSPGEGTGLTGSVVSDGNIAGRVPSRGAAPRHCLKDIVVENAPSPLPSPSGEGRCGKSFGGTPSPLPSPPGEGTRAYVADIVVENTNGDNEANQRGADELSDIQTRAENSVTEAGTWAASLNDPATRRSALQAVAAVAAEQNLATATNWMGVLEREEDRQTVFQSIAYEAMRSDPMMALGLAAALAPSNDRDELLMQAARQWASADPYAAAAWVDKLPDETLRDQLLAAVFVADAKVDGEGAGANISKHLAAGPEQDRAAVAVVQRWGQSAPESAAAWVEQFPETPVKAAAIENLAAVWREQNPEAANEWVSRVMRN